MDLLVDLAGTDPDLNGPVALPLCIVWAIASLAAIYYRYRYGPNVGYYSAMAMAAILMTLLQLVLFLLSYNNPSVIMARQVVAALGTLLLSWLLISVLTSWSESSRVMRISPESINTAYQATRKVSDEPPRLPKLKFLATPINELEVIYPGGQRFSQLIPEASAPYRMATQDADAFPAYQPHYSQPRLRYLTASMQVANTVAFLLAVTGRIVAIFSQSAAVETPFIVVACILIGYVLAVIILSAMLFWRTSHHMSIAARRPLLVLVLLSALEIPRCVSMALHSANVGWYIGSEVFSAIWLFIALWPGMLKNVTEFNTKEDNAFEQRGLVRVEQTTSTEHAASTEPRSTRFSTRSIPEEAVAQAHARSATPTSPRFAMTSRLARTQSALYDVRRASFSSLKRVYTMASSFSTSHDDETAAEKTRKSEEQQMQERKRWTITMDIPQGESLIDLLQHDLQALLLGRRLRQLKLIHLHGH
ncbi:hypothetical protein SYNPS1DRAFT_21357 [Syncephalis pseudoplumigaleata]|uniref:Uncharacterized protein n=1 Tax=Syncephalis pseudoplumigaleata TaxID=1712513 RepID=A0A4P9Z4L6_9FUNG|nr:hypothetical protein SYNPS1DRAFT_21357 [Syncephalis pseudoplumigaleata]|eukprot:RKP27012.1 hypothetical protein SYNPS1DRAFT_21357 [Syncephalis pseudoplumigaleata]